MTRHPKRKPTGRLLRSLYMWHRWIGLTAAVFVVLLAITGLALNHTVELSLDRNFVQSPALLDWYGIHAPDEITAYRAGPLVISAVGGQVYSNRERLANTHAPLVGAVALDGLVVVAVEGKLLLLEPSGELVEQLDSSAGVPAGMRRLGITPDRQLAIQAAHGYYRTSTDFIAWHESDTIEASWSERSVPPPQLAAALRDAYRGNGLPVERVLLDMHSGRILGEWGVYLMDAAALLFLLLAASGVWLWGRRRASARAHRRRVRAHKKSQDKTAAKP